MACLSVARKSSETRGGLKSFFREKVIFLYYPDLSDLLDEPTVSEFFDF